MMYEYFSNLYILSIHERANEYLLITFIQLYQKRPHALTNYLKITSVYISNIWVLLKRRYMYRYGYIQNKCYFKLYIINSPSKMRRWLPYRYRKL